jgi:Uma2 family endonuclease
MAGARDRPAVYADLYDVPENQVGEIIGGELFTTPRPALPHAYTASALGGFLFGPYGRGDGGPGGWVILDEPELHFGDDVLVPDLAGWRRERFTDIPKGVVGIEVVPDWVCEVLSPSTARLDRARKLPLYARQRTAHAWFIDPVAQTLEVMRLEGERWSLIATHAGGAPVRAEPFDAIALDLAALWTL